VHAARPGRPARSGRTGLAAQRRLAESAGGTYHLLADEDIPAALRSNVVKSGIHSLRVACLGLLFTASCLASHRHHVCGHVAGRVATGGTRGKHTNSGNLPPTRRLTIEATLSL
jgi:hypothetical protein